LLRFPRAPGSTDVVQSGPPPEPEARPAVPVGAWVLGAVGVASLGAFAYFGLTAHSELDSLKTTCSPACSDDRRRRGGTKAAIADVALGVGVAALGGAVLWAILSHTGGAKSAAVRVDVAPVAGGAVAGVSGAF